MNTTTVYESAGRGYEVVEPSFLLLLPVLLSVVWILVLLFYGPWVLALLITKVANLLLKDSGLYIGMITSIEWLWCTFAWQSVAN